MANVYAVASGNWSNTAIWNTGTLPTSADIVRPNGFAVTIDQNITVIALRNDASAPAVAGGTFTLTGNYTLNISSDIQCFASSLLTYNGTGTAYITGTNTSAAIISSTTTNTTTTVTHSGTGTLIVDMVINSCILNETNRFNIQVTGGGTLNLLKSVSKGTFAAYPTNAGSSAISVSGTANATINTVDITGISAWGYTINSSVNTATINVIGNITGGAMQAGGTPVGGAIAMSGTNSILNITGNISNNTGGSTGQLQTVFINGVVTVNMIGTINGPPSGINPNSGSIVISNASGVLNLTGNVLGNGSGSTIISVGFCNVTGTVTGGLIANAVRINSGTTTITGTVNGGTGNGIVGVVVNGGTLNHIGTAQASSTASAIGGNAPTTSTVICTGPFLRNTNVVALATQTLQINSAYNPYFEFRKSNGTNVTYVDQSTLNYPAVSNVRLGTTYGSGLYTGTLNVPTAAQVLAGIPVDNTVGTLLMSPADFWNYAISGGFSVGSIGERLQNASTVATTGSQIAAYSI
jgi:hypothetical protein